VPDHATAAPPTLGALLDAAAATLARAGVPEGRREAVRLWSGLSGESAGAVWLARRRATDPAVLGRFETALRRRANGEPLAYVIGRAAFRTIEVTVDARVLIPRPETEGLVEHVLRWSAGRSGGIAADIGTGSGCIALALAVEGRFDRIVATDCSPEAAAVARDNVRRVAPTVPVEIRLGEFLEPLAGQHCRVIVANPPYLTAAEWEALTPDVRAYEPRTALASGVDGLDATRALLTQAPARLEPDGLLALEVDERRAHSVADLARAAGWRVTVYEDVFDRPRYALAVQGGETR
jgi:release factor glutamine methyltransferase